MTKTLDPIPPGEILLEEFIKPLGVSQNKLARDIDVPPARINDNRFKDKRMEGEWFNLNVTDIKIFRQRKFM